MDEEKHVEPFNQTRKRWKKKCELFATRGAHSDWRHSESTTEDGQCSCSPVRNKRVCLHQTFFCRPSENINDFGSKQGSVCMRLVQSYGEFTIQALLSVWVLAINCSRDVCTSVEAQGMRVKDVHKRALGGS
jgi:hypothetical protein